MANFRALTINAAGNRAEIANADTLVVGNGITTLAGALLLSAFTAAVNLDVAKVLTALAGAGGLDFSLATGAFKTSTGANTISGDATLAANKNLTGAAGTGAIDWSALTGTFKTTTGAHTFGGDITQAANKNYTMAAGTGIMDLSAATGTLKAPTGGLLTPTIKASDGTLSITIANATGKATFAGDVDILGNLAVTGTEIVTGATTWIGASWFKGTVLVGDGVGSDTFSLDATSGRWGTAANPDFRGLAEIAHVIDIAPSTTVGQVGAALTVKSAAGAVASGATPGAAGGLLTFQAASGGAGTAVLAAGAGGATNVYGGDAGAANGGAGASGSDILVDGGLATGAGTNGLAKIGTQARTSALTIGRAGITATIASAILLTAGFSQTGANTLSTGTGAVTINGATTFNAAATFAAVAVTASGAASFDLSGGSGIFKTPTGAVTIGPGATTLSGAVSTTGASFTTGAATAIDFSASGTNLPAGTGTAAGLRIGGTNLNTNWTGANANILTAGPASNADNLHTHAGGQASTLLRTGLTTPATWTAGLSGYVSGDNTLSLTDNVLIASSRFFGTSDGTASQALIAGVVTMAFTTVGGVTTAGSPVWIAGGADEASAVGKLTATVPAAPKVLAEVGIVLVGAAAGTSTTVLIQVKEPVIQVA